jgi:hypothetical protein
VRRRILVVGAHAPSISGLQAGQKFSWYIYDYLAKSGYEIGFLGLVPKWECERVTLDERRVFCRWGVVPVTWGTRIRGVATAGELPLAFGVRHSKAFRDRLVGELKLWDPGVVILDHQGWGAAALAAGLNASLQWPTVFGRIWGNVGVLFPVVFFLYGVLCEKVYERFCRLEILGVLLYIPLLINILSCFSSGLLDKRFDGFVLTAFFGLGAI